MDRLFALADQNGIGEAFRIIYNVATKCGLYPRTYKWSIMYAPPSHRNRCLIYTSVKPKGKLLDISVVTGAFPEFYNVNIILAVKDLGIPRRESFDVAKAKKFAQQLEKFFSRIKSNS